MGANPMEDMIEAAFQKVLQDALQPLLERLTDLQVQVTTLTRQQGELLAIVDGVRNSNSMLARFLPKAG